METVKTLKPLRSKGKPKKFVSFDSEDDSKGRMISIDFFDGFHHYTFFDRKKAIEFLYDFKISHNQYVYFVAHNLEYDLVNLFKGHFNLLEYVRWNNTLISAKLENKNIIFIDSFNLSKAPLKKLGDIIGLKKMEFDRFDVEYLKRDSEIVFRYIEMLQSKILKSYGVGLKYTLPAISMAIYLKNFLDFEIERYLEPDVFTSYFGGRTEAFYIGKEKDVNYCDVNSMYPYVMQDYFPDTSSITNADLSAQFGYGKFKIYQEMQISILPKRINNKVYFLNGEFAGIWTLEEIKQFLKYGGEIRETYWIKGTDKGYPYFKGFVNHFYKQKQTAKDKFYRTFYKLILNSLYGKFGERLKGQEMISFNDFNESKMKPIKKFEDRMLIETDKTNESKYSNPLWASYITAKARCYLNKNLIKINKSSKLLYCDTDSIVYSGKEDVLNISNKLGDWSLDKYDFIEIKGAKLYHAKNESEEIYRCKGIPDKFQDLFFNLGYVNFEQPIRFREAIAISNLTDNQKVKIMNYWTDINKSILTKYEKRNVKKNGNTMQKNINEFDKPEKTVKIEYHTLRKEILHLGGIRKTKDIPNWFFKSYFYLFRKNGNSIDELIDDLKVSGVFFKDIDDFLDNVGNKLNIDLESGLDISLLNSLDFYG